MHESVPSHWVGKGSSPLAKGLSEIEPLQWAAFLCDHMTCGMFSVLGMPPPPLITFCKGLLSSLSNCLFLKGSSYEWPGGGMSYMALLVSWSLKGYPSCVFSLRLFWHHYFVFLLLWRNDPVAVTMRKTVFLLSCEPCWIISWSRFSLWLCTQLLKPVQSEDGKLMELCGRMGLGGLSLPGFR